MTLTIELECNARAMLVSCYAPTMDSPEQDKDDFYNQFREVMAGTQHKDKLILWVTLMLGLEEIIGLGKEF